MGSPDDRERAIARDHQRAAEDARIAVEGTPAKLLAQQGHGSGLGAGVAGPEQRPTTCRVPSAEKSCGETTKPTAIPALPAR